MKTQILISLLLVCSVTGAIEDKENTTDSLEIEPKGFKVMHILDENGDPMTIDLTDDHPETLSETMQELHNRVHFYLYTKKTGLIKPQALLVNDVATLKASDFNPKRSTKIVLHGWINSFRSRACTSVRNAYLKHGDYNVIVVDWSAISHGPYAWASNRVPMIGEYISKMIDFLETQGMSLSQLTIVGHSLGAHIAGLSAHYAKSQVNYVVALDPALPEFLTAIPGKRVSRDDAKYVQVIHTNGGHLGYLGPLGHADFYPNGGTKQPGCLIDIGGACSHARSFEYFAESLNSDTGFLAARCGTYVEFVMGMCQSETAFMGEAEPKFNVKGKYYLNTRVLPPFAKGAL